MAILINRRNVLKGSAAAILVSSVGRLSSANAQTSETKPKSKQFVVKTLQSDDRKIRMVPFASPHFAGLLHKYFPGIHETATFSAAVTPAGPMAVILNLVRGPDLIGHNIRWSITTGSGAFEFQMAKYSRPRRKAKTIANTPMLTATVPTLKAGGFMLVTPMFALTPDAYAKNPHLNSPVVIRNGALQGFLAESGNSVTDVRAYLDSAVYADHRVAGRDRGHLAADIAIKRHTEIKFAKAILARLRHGRSKKAILQKLAGTADAALVKTGTRGSRASLREKSKYASTLAMLEVHEGKRALWAAIAPVSQNSTSIPPFSRI